eukprot:7293335-Prymnesium_polylepis.1
MSKSAGEISAATVVFPHSSVPAQPRALSVGPPRGATVRAVAAGACAVTTPVAVSPGRRLYADRPGADATGTAHT